jgi:hypothetical protein
MSLQEDVRRTNDVPIEPVEHPEWKGAHVRPMGCKALGEFRKMAVPDDVGDEQPFELTLHLLAFLTAHCLCDANGVRAFGDDEVAWLESNKTPELLEPIANAAIKLHGLADDDEDRAKN